MLCPSYIYCVENIKNTVVNIDNFSDDSDEIIKIGYICIFVYEQI